MKRFTTHFTPQQAAARLGATLVLRQEANLNNVAELGECDAGSVCFFENPQYLQAALAARPGLLLVPADTDPNTFPQVNLLPVPQPYVMFMLLVRGWLQAEEGAAPRGVHPTAVVDPTAVLGADVTVGPGAVIGAGCTVGDGSVVGPRCVLLRNVSLGGGCRLVANVTVYDDTVLGDRVIAHAGSVLGADGFGYLFVNGRQEKIPQVGRVVIGNDVEIGACACIDRAMMGETRIADGVKIDNLVQVGHNCVIGEHTILCAQVGLAGSTTVGRGCYLAGQVGSAGHLTVGDGVLVGGQSGLAADVPAGTKYFGSPAVEATLEKRMYIALRQLPDMLKSLKKLIKEHEG